MTTVTAGAGAGTGSRIVIALAWLGLGVAIACQIAIVLGGLGHRAGWWHFRVGIQVIRWATTVDLAALVVMLVAVILAPKLGARSAFVPGLAGMLIAIAVAAPPVYQWRVAESLPRIHDITTDTDNPPRFVAILPLRRGVENSTDFDAAVAEQQRKAYPDIVPARLDMPPERALEVAQRTARSLGWEIVAVSPEELRVEATDTTFLFGFKDDVVIRVTASGHGSRVDVRSISRVGRSDIGANAKRIRAFLRELARA